MIRKATVYNLASMAWLVTALGGTLSVYTGATAPYVSPPTLPTNLPILLFVGVIVGVVGSSTIVHLKTRAWRTAGRRANLTPSGGGIFGYPTLSGTVDGRPVRARTVKRERSSSGEGSNTTTTTYTVVEADLDRIAEVGLFVVPTGGRVRQGHYKAGLGIDPDRATVKNEDLAAVGGPTAIGQEVISGRARSALRKLDDGGLVVVGDGDSALDAVLPENPDSRIQAWLTDQTTEHTPIPGDPSTVAIDTPEAILDPDRLQRQAEAVAAVAAAFETAIDYGH